MSVKIHMSKQGYKQKPDRNETGTISQSITENVTIIEIEEFAKEVGENGKAFTPALFSGNRRTENFLSQQVFALDFDGGMTLEEFLERASKYGIFPAFLYATYNHTEKEHRFRAVFIFECEVFDSRVSTIIMGFLLHLFPEADRQCRDAARLFFGGKKVLYMNESAKIDLIELVLSVQLYVKCKDSKNYSRKMKKIADELGVMWCEKTFEIYKCENDDQNEEIISDSDYIIVNVCNSSKYVIFRNTHQHPVRLRPKKEIPMVRNKRAAEIMGICLLFRDFYDPDQDIAHELKFLLATNLLHVDGGKNMFFDGLKTNTERWKIQWNYIKQQFYRPMKCHRGRCPYVEKCRCDTMLDKIQKKIQRIDPPEQYIELKKGEELLHDFLEICCKSQETGIYLISAQTAIGKTTAYCDLAEKYNSTSHKKVLIAVPTNKLQEEVVCELKKRGIEVFCTPHIQRILQLRAFQELQDEIQDLYDTGYGYKVKSVLRAYQEKHETELTELESSLLQSYLNCKDKLDGTSCVVTTHKYFLTLPENILQQYEVIIDEDILMSIFKNTESISFQDLRYVLSQGGIPEPYRSRVEQLMRMPDESVGKMTFGKLRYDERDAIYEKELEIRSSLIGFLESSTYHIDLASEKINYFTAQDLPKVKMIVVSATLKRELYHDYCQEDKIFYCEVEKAEYKGKLLQYSAYSVTRNCLEQVGYEVMENKVKSITGNEKINIITFKKYSEGREIYFGKTEGFNEYKGKDIAVIGTPYSIPFIYRLIGTYLGYDGNDCMCRRNVIYNGYRFPIMSYGTQKMQELLFYFLQSELEQAIGRARLLRYDCTVYLFSNFPCNQAEIIQEDYLDL